VGSAWRQRFAGHGEASKADGHGGAQRIYVRKGVKTVKGQQEIHSATRASSEVSKGTRFALWWLRHYDSITHFWRGFSWVWVIGILLYVVVGYLDLARALFIILLIGVIANTGIYCSIRAISSHLKQLEDGPEKEEAHELMVQIIRKRILSKA
jgi:hypothetical protein